MNFLIGVLNIIPRKVDMPLTKKGSKIMAAMKKQYGAKKGKQVFYASQNKGIIKGTHKKDKGFYGHTKCQTIF